MVLNMNTIDRHHVNDMTTDETALEHLNNHQTALPTQPPHLISRSQKKDNTTRSRYMDEI